MRILDEWAYEELRCTAMIMNGRHILKVENNLLEVTYKFRDSQISSLQELKSKLDEDFYSQSRQVLKMMNKTRFHLLNDSEEEVFPTII